MKTVFDKINLLLKQVTASHLYEPFRENPRVKSWGLAKGFFLSHIGFLKHWMALLE